MSGSFGGWAKATQDISMGSFFINADGTADEGIGFTANKILFKPPNPGSGVFFEAIDSHLIFQLRGLGASSPGMLMANNGDNCHIDAIGGSIYLNWVSSAGNGQTFIGNSAGGLGVLNAGTAFKTGGGSWGVYSDPRTKDRVGDVAEGLTEVLKLADLLAVWKYKESFQKNTEPFYGVNAEELQAFFPEAVTNTKGILGGQEQDILVVDSSPIIWVYAKAIQQLYQMINARSLITVGVGSSEVLIENISREEWELLVIDEARNYLKSKLIEIEGKIRESFLDRYGYTEVLTFDRKCDDAKEWMHTRQMSRISHLRFEAEDISSTQGISIEQAMDAICSEVRKNAYEYNKVASVNSRKLKEVLNILPNMARSELDVIFDGIDTFFLRGVDRDLMPDDYLAS